MIIGLKCTSDEYKSESYFKTLPQLFPSLALILGHVFGNNPKGVKGVKHSLETSYKHICFLQKLAVVTYNRVHLHLPHGNWNKSTSWCTSYLRR